MATPKTIVLKGDGLYKEALAGGTITPGHLVTRNASSAFVVGPAAGLNAFAMFALEDELQGKDITDNYVSGDLVVAVMPMRGSEIYALVAASAAAVVVGDELESAGDGTVRKAAAVAVAQNNLRRIVARAVEAVDNSANAAGPVRIKIEIV